jgi:hypothetical protein
MPLFLLRFSLVARLAIRFVTCRSIGFRPGCNRRL